MRSGLRQLDRYVEPFPLDGGLVGEATFAVPTDLPLGYHRLCARSGSTESSCTLIVTPDLAGPARVARRPAGLGLRRPALQRPVRRLVGRRRPGRHDRPGGVVWVPRWARTTCWSTRCTPVSRSPPMEPSPYLPKSRRFFNPLYIRVERIPEYASLAVPGPRGRRPGADQPRQAPRRRRRDRPGRRVDREAQGPAEGARRRADRRPREQDYQAFCDREGESLVDFARWSALAETHGNDFRELAGRAAGPGLARRGGVRRGPRRARRLPHVAAVGRRRAAALAQAKAVGAGMRLGVMHDLAVGVHPGGADAWRLQDTYATGIAGRRPGGPVQPGGPGLGPAARGDPDRLAENGYAPFRDLIAGVLRHAGGRARSTTSSGCSGCGGCPRATAPRPGHLRLLRPPGDDRRPRARGAPRRRRGRRGGPRHGRAVGAGLPAPPGHPRHVAPVVRAGLRRRSRCRPSGGGSTPWPRSPPTTCRRRPATSPRTTSGCATIWACSPVRSTRRSPPTTRSARRGWTSCARAACSVPTRRRRRRSPPCTATSR